ncbi:hypothetical protein ACERIT_07875 [Halopenitus sp. H-Gu1]|uniref:hypothetical protein n=1 Tax=Halopenitus sp. H-Gu1 TaxID=3242697 RepID=UPI00359CE603
MDGRRDELLASLFRDTRRNAIVGWVIFGLVALAFVESLFGFDLLWTVVSAATMVVMALPAVVRRDWRVILPWELLLLAALPVATRAVIPDVEIGIFASYLALAAFALLVVVELDMFTEMRVTHWFAVALVVVTTLASGAVWTIIRWYLNRSMGTTYLLDNEALMIEFVRIALAGIAAGLLFDLYFRRRNQMLKRRLESELLESNVSGEANES